MEGCEVFNSASEPRTDAFSLLEPMDTSLLVPVSLDDGVFEGLESLDTNQSSCSPAAEATEFEQSVGSATKAETESAQRTTSSIVAQSGKGRIKHSQVPSKASSSRLPGRAATGATRMSSSKRSLSADAAPAHPFLRSSSSAAAARRLSLSVGLADQSHGVSPCNSASASIISSGGRSAAVAPAPPVTLKPTSSSTGAFASKQVPSSTHADSRRASLPAVFTSKPELRKGARPAAQTFVRKSTEFAGLSRKPDGAGSNGISQVALKAHISASDRSTQSALPLSNSCSSSKPLTKDPHLSHIATRSSSLAHNTASPASSVGRPSRSAHSTTAARKSPSPLPGDGKRPQADIPVPQPSLALDRGPRVSLRRKSLNSELRESRLISLPVVDNRAADDVRLDLRGHKVRSLDGNVVNLTPKMEFVYLRDNKLSSLSGLEILRRVKVLDLSFNDLKGADFEPLASCKALQQLYLAGNQIVSMSNLPTLPSLEFLSVAQNKLKSLAMTTQPRLQVLAASKNRISTLKGFPHLPALEHLRLEENPLLETPHVEAGAILLVGPSMKKFNDRDLSVSEVELAKMYPAHAAFCIREGWKLESPEEAEDSILNFLAGRWGHCPAEKGYVLRKLSLDRPMEEDPCTCDFLFEMHDGTEAGLELDLKYQWFASEKGTTGFLPIEGAVTKEYWPKHDDIGSYLKVECTSPMFGSECAPLYLISLPVVPGNEIPKVLSLDIEGELIEGHVLRGSAHVAWRGGTPSRAVVSWLRFTENGSPLAILGADDYEYQLTVDDIGANLVFMYTPVTQSGTRGESLHTTTNLIQAAPPSVSSMQVIGEATEGNTIEGAGVYFGGKEGPSVYEWLREDSNSGEFKLVCRGNCEYFLTEEDVGLHIMFIYTPVNNQGIQGIPASVISAKVKRAPPKITELRVIGDLREGSKVAVSCCFVGGVEGASRVQWFKTKSPLLGRVDELEAISTSKVAKSFRIPLQALGHYLVVKYIPVRSDGESGEPFLAISDSKVEMLPPGLTLLSMNGDFVEGQKLTATYGYIGGYEGCSQYSWYLHELQSSPGLEILEAAGNREYHLTAQAVNKFVSFKCVPVRDDGLVGEGRSVFSEERVRPGTPKLVSLQIIGDAIEGSELVVTKQYWGGEEGSSKLQWFLTRPDGLQREIRGAVGSSYTVSNEDLEGFLCVSCEPVRADGVRGATVVSQLLGPVLPSPPTCESLEICGHAVEGGTLTFKVAYKGGEQGVSRYEWRRRDCYGREDLLGTNATLHLQGKDVGFPIRLVFIPVRSDGMVGDPVTVLSDVIVDADPEGKELEIPDCCEDVSITPWRVYFGGQEGDVQHTWYRTADKALLEGLPKDARPLAQSLSYTPRLEDVGHHLVVLWVPTRKDGKQGKPVLACSRLPVEPAPPSVRSVLLKEVSPGTFCGDGKYHGGLEGKSEKSWYRENPDGCKLLIEGASSRIYVATHNDYMCRIIFCYLPVRMDGTRGEAMLSEPSNVLYPELPRVQQVLFAGKPVEGEVLTALEVIPTGAVQEEVWRKYKKELQYQWSRSWANENSFNPIALQRLCTYEVRLEDVGYCLRCECLAVDVFGRSGEPALGVSSPVQPGFPKVEKLEIDGQGFHTSLYAVRGLYFGGKEGKSKTQWFRAMAGSPDLIPILGETGRMYEANVDDVGYRLVAVYTPFRDDGAEGVPTSASTDPISIEPEIGKEVKQKSELGSVKFEALRDRERSPMKGQQQVLASLERRVLDVNRKRVKLVKPGSKTSFPSTELRGTYAPPFHVEVCRNDQHRLKIVIDMDTEVELMVQSRHIRDVIVLLIRGFAQKFNSTPLNLLLKM